MLKILGVITARGGSKGIPGKNIKSLLGKPLIVYTIEAAKAKMAKRKELVNTTNGRELNEKLKSMKSELKEARDALSDYLQNYQKKTGFNEYEGPDGELRQIVFSVKLVRKTKLNWD